MSRKAWFLGLAMSLAFAPGVLADTILNVTNSTLGAGSNTLDFLTVNAANSGNGNGASNGGGLDTFIPFSIFFSGNSLTGNSLTGASLTLNSGGTANARVFTVSVSPVDASGPFFAPPYSVTGSVNTKLTSIQSGGRTLAGIGQQSGGFDLLALGFGPDLLAGQGVLVTGLADFRLDSFGVSVDGLNAITQQQFITEGTFFAGGTLTETFTPIPPPPPPPVPEPSTLSLLCTGLLAGLGTAVRKRV